MVDFASDKIVKHLPEKDTLWLVAFGKIALLSVAFSVFSAVLCSWQALQEGFGCYEAGGSSGVDMLKVYCLPSGSVA